MKWINADAARDIFEPLVIKVHDAELTSAFTHTLILRSNVPSIDIVFCKECKFWGRKDNKGLNGVCFKGASISQMKRADFSISRRRTADDFCSYGKRRE